MEILYKSTRGGDEQVTASMAILKGLSENGGLFVPTEIPVLDIPMEEHGNTWTAFRSFLLPMMVESIQ